MANRNINFIRCRKSCRKSVYLVTIITVFILYTAALNVYREKNRRDFPSGAQINGANDVTIMSRDDYNITKQPLTNKVVVDTHSCHEWFEPTFEENLNHISKYPRGVADQYISKIVGDSIDPSTLRTDFPVIATAANSQFYDVSQGVLKSVYDVLLPKYKNIKIVYYDLGMNERQRKQLINYCDICDVRSFPFEELPGHVTRLRTYTWKPVIVKILLREFGWVWWIDSSVRFLTNDLDPALKYSQDNSILFFTYGVSLSVARNTDSQTMKYLKEDPCKFRHLGEIEATFVLFHADHVTDTVVDSWLSCALNANCMAPRGTELKLHCSISDTSDGRCHRFDQAVLGILLRRLFHESNDYPTVTKPFHIHAIRRGNAVSFLPR